MGLEHHEKLNLRLEAKMCLIASLPLWEASALGEDQLL